MKPYYDEDGITIYHGDCRVVLPSVGLADLLLTDPPYGIGLSTKYQVRSEVLTRGDHGPWKSYDHPALVGDDEPFDPAHLLPSARRLVLWGANHYADRLPTSPSWLVWNRLSGASHAADAELAWTNLGGTVRMFTHLWDGYKRASEIGFHVHPTQKPVALMRWVLERWTEPGDLVLDPYMGSGPVARAAMDTGRRYIGIEIEERYCEIAVQRLAQGVLEFG